MSFAAEPYGIFVDDLVSSLTGGITRERFVHLTENQPFRLAAGTDVVTTTVRVRGIADGAFMAFSPFTDFDVVDGIVTWRADAEGNPAADATWPDRGTVFWASYERTPDPQAPPKLTDRNPGSVTRTLAESFAREFAVVSTQLDTVHKAAFLDTANGSDLDHVAALVGIERRSQVFASGEVVFSRTSPAPADVFIPEGTLISTSDVPAITVETTEDRTLRSGTLSAAAPVQAMAEGAEGVAGANTLTALNRPILGVQAVANPEPLSFGASETDEMLRRRAARALETAGRSTRRAIIGALASLDAIREQDVRLEEDHLGFPGVVKVTVAAELNEAERIRAAELIEEHRPAGVRVLHNLPLPPDVGVEVGAGGGGGGEGGVTEPPTEEDISLNRFPVGVAAAITPASANLTAAEKQSLLDDVRAAIEAAVEDAGVGEAVIYNRIVAAAMAVEGVYDAVLDVYHATEDGPTTGRLNLRPAADLRPELVEHDISIVGALIALDVTVTVERIGLAATGDAATELAKARDDIAGVLEAQLPMVAGDVTPGSLQALLPATEAYLVEGLSYTAEFIDEGLRVQQANPTLQPQAEQRLWLRALQVREETQ